MVYRIAGYDDARRGRQPLVHLRRARRQVVHRERRRPRGRRPPHHARPVGLRARRRTSAREHFVILSHPEQAERAAGADRHRRGGGSPPSRRRWDQPWSGRIPMVLPGSHRRAGQAAAVDLRPHKFVAFVVYQPVRDDGFEHDRAPHLRAGPQPQPATARTFQLSTLTHELDHAAVAPFAGPPSRRGCTRAWPTGWRRAGARRAQAAGAATGVLPRDYQFTTGSGDRHRARPTRESRSAISYLAVPVRRRRAVAVHQGPRRPRPRRRAASTTTSTPPCAASSASPSPSSRPAGPAADPRSQEMASESDVMSSRTRMRRATASVTCGGWPTRSPSGSPTAPSAPCPTGATAADLAASIGRRLAKAAVAATVDGATVDLVRPARRRRDRRHRHRGHATRAATCCATRPRT